MARRKNVKRIDPRYFLNETVNRLDEDEREELTLGDLQSDEKFTGGSREEQLLTRMKARKILSAMSKEELAAFSKSLDAEQVAALRHILAHPLYKE